MDGLRSSVYGTYCAEYAKLLYAMRGLLFAFFVFHAQTTELFISSPQPGDTLRGQIEITGNLNEFDFSSAELSFSFAADTSNPALNWFIIQTYTQPPASSTLALWDTTALTDGDYSINLRVFFQDGTSKDAIVPDLKIRNDTPLPTPTFTMTPEPFNPITESTPLQTLTVDFAPTLAFSPPTPLPPNPAALEAPMIYSTFIKGSLTTLLIFAVIALVLYQRREN